MKSIISTALLGLSVASVGFASEQNVVEYQAYSAYMTGACPAEIIELVESKDRLKLTFDATPPSELVLSGSPTKDVSVPAAAKLSKEEDGTYMLNKTSELKIGDKKFSIKQLWVANNESAFYVGNNSSCLIMTSRAAETDSHSQPRG